MKTFSLLLLFALFAAGTASAAPALNCKAKGGSQGAIMVAPAGNGAISATGSYADEAGGSVTISCVGELISAGEVPGFGKDVETFWFQAASACPFDFLQLDDSAYRQGNGPMRLTCNNGSCPIRSFLCGK